MRLTDFNTFIKSEGLRSEYEKPVKVLITLPLDCHDYIKFVAYCTDKKVSRMIVDIVTQTIKDDNFINNY